jgi:hypothetical protein
MDAYEVSKAYTDGLHGDYRCQFCGQSAPAAQWQARRDSDGNECCPHCLEPYDVRAAILAQEGDD